MLKRYCITYVGDDSTNHKRIVWAKNHNEATKKAKSKFKDLETVSSIRRTSNPFVVWGIVLIVITLLIIELVH